MQRRNTILIWIISILIFVFMSVGVSPGLRHRIRQFIGDDTSNYYRRTINASDSESLKIEIITHTIVKLNDYFMGYSKKANGLIVINSEIDLNLHVNPYTQHCSSCH